MGRSLWAARALTTRSLAATQRFSPRLAVFSRETAWDMVGGLGLILAAYGLTELRNPNRSPLSSWLFASWLFYVLGFHGLANFRPDSEMAVNIASRFWLQAWIPLWIFAGWGLCKSPLPKYAAIAFAIVVPSAQLIYHFPKFGYGRRR